MNGISSSDAEVGFGRSSWAYVGERLSCDQVTICVAVERIKVGCGLLYFQTASHWSFIRWLDFCVRALVRMRQRVRCSAHLKQMVC